MKFLKLCLTFFICFIYESNSYSINAPRPYIPTIDILFDQDQIQSENNEDKVNRIPRNTLRNLKYFNRNEPNFNYFGSKVIHERKIKYFTNETYVEALVSHKKTFETIKNDFRSFHQKTGRDLEDFLNLRIRESMQVIADTPSIKEKLSQDPDLDLSEIQDLPRIMLHAGSGFLETLVGYQAILLLKKTKKPENVKEKNEDFFEGVESLSIAAEGEVNFVLMKDFENILSELVTAPVSQTDSQNFITADISAAEAEGRASWLCSEFVKFLLKLKFSDPFRLRPIDEKIDLPKGIKPNCSGKRLESRQVDFKKSAGRLFDYHIHTIAMHGHTIISQSDINPGAPSTAMGERDAEWDDLIKKGIVEEAAKEVVNQIDLKIQDLEKSIRSSFNQLHQKLDNAVSSVQGTIQNTAENSLKVLVSEISLNRKEIRSVNKAIKDQTKSIENLTESIEEQSKKLDQMDSKLDDLGEKMEEVNDGIKEIKTKIDKLEKKVNKNGLMTAGVLLANIAAPGVGGMLLEGSLNVLGNTMAIAAPFFEPASNMVGPIVESASEAIKIDNLKQKFESAKSVFKNAKVRLGELGGNTNSDDENADLENNSGSEPAKDNLDATIELVEQENQSFENESPISLDHIQNILPELGTEEFGPNFNANLQQLGENSKVVFGGTRSSLRLLRRDPFVRRIWRIAVRSELVKNNAILSNGVGSVQDLQRFERNMSYWWRSYERQSSTLGYDKFRSQWDGGEPSELDQKMKAAPSVSSTTKNASEEQTIPTESPVTFTEDVIYQKPQMISDKIGTYEPVNMVSDSIPAKQNTPPSEKIELVEKSAEAGISSLPSSLNEFDVSQLSGPQPVDESLLEHNRQLMSNLRVDNSDGKGYETKKSAPSGKSLELSFSTPNIPTVDDISRELAQAEKNTRDEAGRVAETVKANNPVSEETIERIENKLENSTVGQAINVAEDVATGEMTDQKLVDKAQSLNVDRVHQGVQDFHGDVDDSIEDTSENIADAEERFRDHIAKAATPLRAEKSLHKVLVLMSNRLDQGIARIQQMKQLVQETNEQAQLEALLEIESTIGLNRFFSGKFNRPSSLSGVTQNKLTYDESFGEYVKENNIAPFTGPINSREGRGDNEIRIRDSDDDFESSGKVDDSDKNNEVENDSKAETDADNVSESESGADNESDSDSDDNDSEPSQSGGVWGGTQSSTSTNPEAIRKAKREYNLAVEKLLDHDLIANPYNLTIGEVKTDELLDCQYCIDRLYGYDEDFLPKVREFERQRNELLSAIEDKLEEYRQLGEFFNPELWEKIYQEGIEVDRYTFGGLALTMIPLGQNSLEAALGQRVDMIQSVRNFSEGNFDFATIGPKTRWASVIDFTEEIVFLGMLSKAPGLLKNSKKSGKLDEVLEGVDDVVESAKKIGVKQNRSSIKRFATVFGFNKNPLPNSTPMDIHLFPDSDASIRIAASRIKPTEEVFNVIIHGSKKEFQVIHNGKIAKLTHRDLSRYMYQNGWDGKSSIRLISCHTGACDKGAARNLANKLGVKVKAPDDLVWVHADGRMTIGPDQKTNSGKWNEFNPGE